VNHKLLSEDRIASLFERAADGHRPVDVSVGNGRARWLRTIDFTRPTKFTPDQENRLRRAHELFCRLAATKLAAEHRISLEINIVDVLQLTWADAHALVGRAALSATLEADPIGTKLLMVVERPLLLVCIERLLGSPMDEEAVERTLTDIDLVLVKRVFTALTGSLSTTWEQMAGIAMRQLAMDPHLETAQVVATSEPTLAIVMEARLQDTTSKIVVLLPHASVHPVAASYSKRAEGDGRHDPDAAEAVRVGLGDIDITLRAEVGETRLPVREVLSLAPGDIVRLGIPADAPIALQADGVRLHDVRPGRHGRARAVQVLAPEGSR
jgi:flagellar motor switch protein FliM